MRPAKTSICLGIGSVGSEPSRCALCVAKDSNFLQMDSEDSDQTGRIPVFAGREGNFVGDVVLRIILFCDIMITIHVLHVFCVLSFK